MSNSTTTRQGYVFDKSWERERERLARLSAGFDPVTLAHLERLGVGPGWRCLEVGAGEGSVARWLAERVGPSGRVVATDIDPAFLDRGPNLDVLQHDVTREPFPAEPFDLAHTRLLLEHLPARATALEHVAAAVRPGGWVVVEDFDWSSAVPGSRHGAELIRRTIDVAMAVMGEAGYDQHYGRRLPDELNRVGLGDVDASGWVPLLRGGTAGIDWFRFSVERLRAPLVAGGLSEAETDALLHLLDDPEFCFFGPVLVTARGRRPPGAG